MYDVLAALAAHTGRPASDFVGPTALATVEQDAAGTLSVSSWDASLGDQPTIEDLLSGWDTSAPGPAALRAHAAARRWAVETGGITVDGVAIATDRESQGLITGAVAYLAASGAASLVFKGRSGWVTLSAAQVQAIGVAVAAHVQAAFAAERAVDEAIAAGTIGTTAEIDAAAWPATA